jgi:TonB family protein
MWMLPVLALVAFVAVSPGKTARVNVRETQLKNAVAAQPDSVEPYLELAAFYDAANRRADAESVLRAALRRVRESGAVFAGFARLYHGQEPDKLFATIQEWTALDPQNPAPYMAAAQHHVSIAAELPEAPDQAMAHLTSARDLLETAIRMVPDNPRPYQILPTVLKRIALVTDDADASAALERAAEAARKTYAELFERAGGIPNPKRAAQPYPNAVWARGATQPVKIHHVAPVMPQSALDKRMEGLVIIETVIDEHGTVVEAHVVRSVAMLDAAALEAVKQWRFRPVVVDGKPIAVVTQQFIEMRLPY